MVIVSNLDVMESIVENNENLSWDGWSVVELTKSDKGSTSNRGVLVNNKWHLKKMFVPSRNGWEIPSKYMR